MTSHVISDDTDIVHEIQALWAQQFLYKFSSFKFASFGFLCSQPIGFYRCTKLCEFSRPKLFCSGQYLQQTWTFYVGPISLSGWRILFVTFYSNLLVTGHSLLLNDYRSRFSVSLIAFLVSDKLRFTIRKRSYLDARTRLTLAPK